MRFVGDLHLGDGSSHDSFRREDRRLIAFLRECEGACDAVVFMGDALDIPQAWTLRRALRAHPGVVRTIRSLASRVQVVFVRGNHDWNVDYERVFPGASVCVELRVGETRVMHGHQLDRYCRPEHEGHQLQMKLHHLAERAFAFHFRLPIHEHDTWQNHAAHWLGGRYGHHLRRMSRIYRALGLVDRAESHEAFIHYWSRALWGDSCALFEPATRWVREEAAPALVCGHTHLPGVVEVEGGTYVNAGSWAFGAADYAQWDGESFSALDYATGESHGDRHYRWMLEGEDRGDFFTWWDRHYRGRFRFDDACATPTRA